MRLSNKNKKGYYYFSAGFVLIVLFTGIVLFLIQRFHYGNKSFSAALLFIIPAFIAMVYYIRGKHIFEYDSDGEALHFRNKNVVFFWKKTLNDEFPKYKLESFEIVDAVFFRQLYIKISSKKNASVLRKYDISYVSNKELSNLKMSLSKVVKANSEKKRENKS